MNSKNLKTLMKRGNFKDADALCDQLRADQDSDHLKELQRQIHDKLTTDAMPGPTYLDWLQWFHAQMNPKSYIEIGVESGQSLQFARGDTKAIGVDPEPKIVYGTNAWVQIFKAESDQFFADNDPKKIFNGKIDLAFIDGLHYYEQALRDFINVEKSCCEDSIILFHDVAPAVAATATREWNTTYWAGDTWKMMPILQKYRPDLKIATLSAYPTGLGVVTNLNPNSTVLEDNFDSMIDEMKDTHFSSYKLANLINNNFDRMIEHLK
jgi:hypothetical protein